MPCPKRFFFFFSLVGPVSSEIGWPGEGNGSEKGLGVQRVGRGWQ